MGRTPPTRTLTQRLPPPNSSPTPLPRVLTLAAHIERPPDSAVGATPSSVPHRRSQPPAQPRARRRARAWRTSAARLAAGRAENPVDLGWHQSARCNRRGCSARSAALRALPATRRAHGRRYHCEAPRSTVPRRTTRRNPVGTHGRDRDPIVTQLRQAALDVREVPVPKPGNVVLPDEGVPEHILHQREQHECWDEDVPV